MKAQGIIIYTMTFPVARRRPRRTCTETARPSPTSTSTRRATAELQEAFVQIADELSALRIAE